MPQNKYYITTPIYYVNDVPHIGHAYTNIASDVIARSMRLTGKDVFFLTGTDEHGQKVEKSASKNDMTPQDFTDKLSESFRDLTKILNISNDDFIRTTEERHKKAVQYFWQKLEQSGAIYLGQYEGWYSTRDEAFYDKSELTPEGLAPTGSAVEWVQEPSYFFNLSKWQDRLLAFYETNPSFIRPSSRYNEVVNFVKGGLHDLSISRTSFKWGVNVPGDSKHVVYVWLDALVNYISALGYPNIEDSSKMSKFWPANVHVVGKDIVRFHAVYWPAFLMAADLELPGSIMAHGWWTNEGEKISKSLGNVIDPVKLIEEFGVDQVRYFLMREINFGSDGNYSRASLIARNDSELANKLGNLVQRTTAFIYKNEDGIVPDLSNEQITQLYGQPLLILAQQIAEENIGLIENFDINGVLSNIMNLVEEANIFIDYRAPWQLKKTDHAQMLEVLYTLLEVIRYIAIMLQPFIPESASKILHQLAVDKEHRLFKHLTQRYAIKAGSKINSPQPIFPKYGAL